MMPPRPAVIAHGKVLRVLQGRLRWNETSVATSCPSLLAVRPARPSNVSGCPVSLSRLSRGETRMPLLEALRQRATVPTSLWVLNRQSLGKASPTCTPPPICTLAPFLKPRWSQDRGRRERLRDTACAETRKAFDSQSSDQKTSSALTPRRSCSQTREQRFESPCRFERPARHVTILRRRSKNFCKSVT